MLGGSQTGYFVVFRGQMAFLLILFSCGFSLLSAGGAVAFDISVMSYSAFIQVMNKHTFLRFAAMNAGRGYLFGESQVI